MIKQADVIWKNEKPLVKTNKRRESKMKKKDSFLCPKNGVIFIYIYTKGIKQGTTNYSHKTGFPSVIK